MREFLLYKKPNSNGYYNYQRNVGNFIECGCFKTYEEGLMYAAQEGYDHIKINGQKFIVFKGE